MMTSVQPLPLDIAQFDFGNASAATTGDFVPCATVMRSAGVEAPLQLNTQVDMLHTWRSKIQEALEARVREREENKVSSLLVWGTFASVG